MGVYAPFSMQENPGKRKQPEFFKCERHSVHKPYVSIERQISSVCSWVTKVEAFYFLTFVAAVFLEHYMKERRCAGSCAQRRSTKAKLSCVECGESYGFPLRQRVSALIIYLFKWMERRDYQNFQEMIEKIMFPHCIM